MMEKFGLEPLAFGLYFAWLLAGATDFQLHRRTNLPTTSGLKESALHGAQLACVGSGVLAWLCLDSNQALALVLTGLAGVHVALAYIDTATADGVRRISPLEQHIHSVLDACPWIFAIGVAMHVSPGWHLSLHSREPETWIALLLPALLLVGVPWSLEFVASLRFRAQRGSNP